MEENDRENSEEQQEYAVFGSEAPIEEVITSLMEGNPVFRCRGIVRIKVGEKVFQLPIRSVDVEESIRLLAHKRPNPPVERVFVRPDEAKKSGQRGGWVTVANEASPAYIEAQRTYTTELNYLIMLKGLDVSLKDSSGIAVWDPNNESCQDKEASLRILRSLGLTSWQFTDIVEAIQNLTNFAVEELVKNSARG